MRVLLVLITLAAMFMAPKFASCDEKAESKKHFDVGLSLMKVEDFDGAAAEFRQSVKLFPTKNGLFNLANAYKGLHRYSESLSTLDLLKGEFGEELGEELKEAVETLHAEIKAIIAYLSIVVSKPGAMIKVDGEQAGKSPMSLPLALGPGVHTISAHLDGYKTARRKISLVSGRRVSLEFKLKKSDLGAAEPVAQEEEPLEPAEPEDEYVEEDQIVDEGQEREGLSPVPFIVAGAVTAALGVTTVVLDVKTNDRFDTADKSGENTDRDSAESLQTAERVFFALTLAGAATAVVLFFLTDFGGGEETLEDVALDLVSPVVFDGGAGFAVSGRF